MVVILKYLFKRMVAITSLPIYLFGCSLSHRKGCHYKSRSNQLVSRCINCPFISNLCVVVDLLTNVDNIQKY